MAEFVGAVDQGTTSTRFLVFDHDGTVVAGHQLEHRQILPRAGWVEHDPVEIWERTSTVVQSALRGARLSASDLAAVGLANQRETTVVWDRTTGRPYCNALVWQDTRTDRIAARRRFVVATAATGAESQHQRQRTGSARASGNSHGCPPRSCGAPGMSGAGRDGRIDRSRAPPPCHIASTSGGTVGSYPAGAQAGKRRTASR